VVSTIALRYTEVLERARAACERVGRDPSEVTTIVVTKQRYMGDIQEVQAAGARNMAENYVQEALGKVEQAGAGVIWHFIGHLQRNKAKAAVGFAEVIHAVDSLRLAEEIDRRALEIGKRQRVLVEANIAGEETKHGVSADAVEALLRGMAALPGVLVEGLMVMPPPVDDAAEARPAFARAREIAMGAAGRGLLPERPQLSMGMSGDFEVAVEEGATLIRVGTAIFGPRAT
jgi:PLP dependent protein